MKRYKYTIKSYGYVDAEDEDEVYEIISNRQVFELDDFKISIDEEEQDEWEQDSFTTLGMSIKDFI